MIEASDVPPTSDLLTRLGAALDQRERNITDAGIGVIAWLTLSCPDGTLAGTRLEWSDDGTSWTVDDDAGRVTGVRVVWDGRSELRAVARDREFLAACARVINHEMAQRIGADLFPQEAVRVMADRYGVGR